MDLTQILLAVIGGIFGLFALEGVGYLIINKLVLSKKEKTEVKNDVIGNGTHLIDLYKEVDSIVESKTKPINEKLDKLSEKFTKVACFRNCEMRIRNEEDADRTHIFSKEEYIENIRKK